jgi:integrase
MRAAPRTPAVRRAPSATCSTPESAGTQIRSFRFRLRGTLALRRQRAPRIHATERQRQRLTGALGARAPWPKREPRLGAARARRDGLRTRVAPPVVSGCGAHARIRRSYAAGRRRSPATMPGFHADHPPRIKGLRYPADPPTVEEVVAVMRIAGDGLHGRRLRGLVVVLWRAGLRIDEALALREADLDRRRGALLVRRRTGGRRREVGMDDWGWQELEPWLTVRVDLPIGPLFCIINGRTRGRRWTTSGVRAELRRAAARPAFGVALLPTSCGTPTRSRWPVKASRSSSSSASSGTATSGSRRSICRASTAPKSSRPSTPR